MSFFDCITQLPEDPILRLPIAFAADLRPDKVNLGIGSYKDSEGHSYILNTVRKAESILLTKQLNKEYAPIAGDPEFVIANLKLLFGGDFLSSYTGGLFGSQTLGGTGALRLGGEFLYQETSRTLFLPEPSWPNHHIIFSRSDLNIKTYRYYDEITHQFDFDGMCADIELMAPASTILLHCVCHNPTGIDPTEEQWRQLSTLIKKKNVIPFFDMAYQGFAENLDKDAFAIRYFASQGHEMLVANSLSKNFGLYNERVGGICILTHHKETSLKVGSQIKQIIRGSYSNPPQHGGRVVTEILRSDILRKEWIEELANMNLRIQEMRHSLIAGLESKSTHKNWNFLHNQKGFFSFSGLTLEQVNMLLEKYAIYLPDNGRINIAGLNQKNMDYVVEAIVAVTEK